MLPRSVLTGIRVWHEESTVVDDEGVQAKGLVVRKGKGKGSGAGPRRPAAPQHGTTRRGGTHKETNSLCPLYGTGGKGDHGQVSYHGSLTCTSLSLVRRNQPAESVQCAYFYTTLHMNPLSSNRGLNSGRKIAPQVVSRIACTSHTRPRPSTCVHRPPSGGRACGGS